MCCVKELLVGLYRQTQLLPCDFQHVSAECAVVDVLQRRQPSGLSHHVCVSRGGFTCGHATITGSVCVCALTLSPCAKQPCVQSQVLPAHVISDPL